MSQETVESLRARLRERLKRIPKSIAQGQSVQRVRSFKELARKATKLVDNPRATAQQLASTINEYLTYQ